MYKNLSEARSLAEELARGLPPSQEPRVAVFPSFVALAAVSEVLRKAAREVIVGAQNIHFEKEGAFTGEVSADMVRSAGAEAVLLGHSERRHIFLESDEVVGKKVARAVDAGLVPILCVGEKLEEREAGETFSVVTRQLNAGLLSLSTPEELARVVIAYEPVWAIGTGKTATPAQGQEVHKFIRGELGKAFASRRGTKERAEETLVLYGGSVKPENSPDLLAEPDIDGLLVGGASLKADSFLKICKAAA
jgi:triosephosphate isomerase